MRDLFQFFIRYSRWFVFLFYVIISCMLLFHNNPYQKSVYLTSANSINATVCGAAQNVTSYLHLREINEDLQLQNARLEAKVLELQREVNDFKLYALYDSITSDSLAPRYGFILAHVISNSTSRTHNYITIDRGSADGIRPEMGVVDQNGIVGIVDVTSPHASRIISLLNPKMRLSCKISGSDYFGSLVWDGKHPDQCVLEEMPRHEQFVKGDTIVTSGYSAVFPPGLPIGTILSHAKEHDDNFVALRIKLLTDFSRLSTVRVITDDMSQDLIAIHRGDEN